MITITYECADGTPFEAHFSGAEQAARRFRHDREHNLDPLTPLADALERLGEVGTARSYSEAGLPFPDAWHPGPLAEGFPYFSEEPVTPEELAQMFAGCAQLLEKYGSALGIWRDYCLPNIRSACEALDRADASVPLATLAELANYSMHMTMIPAYVCGNDMQLLAAVCPPVPDVDPGLVALELAQGYECETMRADYELFGLAQRARQSPRAMDALESGYPGAAIAALRATAQDAEFFVELDAFLGEFGRRCEGWDIACPTWNEQGPGFWAQVRHMAREGARDPRELIEQGAARRVALLGELAAQLADEPEKLARFERRVERVAPYVAVREDRAFWQLVGQGCLRHAVLRRGEELVKHGSLDAPADVLFLTVAEVESAAADFRSVVAARRATHERLKTLTPPLVLGGEAIAPAEPDAPTDGVIRGVGASRGTASGPARVILDLADADRVEPGDVLVCVMTSPPWTPLFGIAAAIVADTGSPASHPGIAAREYGIPAVLGTRIATSAIPDGAMVTVDGTAGTVTLV